MSETRTPTDAYRTAKRRYLRVAGSGLSLLLVAFLLDQFLDPRAGQHLVAALSGVGTLIVLTALTSAAHLNELYARTSVTVR